MQKKNRAEFFYIVKFHFSIKIFEDIFCHQRKKIISD